MQISHILECHNIRVYQVTDVDRHAFSNQWVVSAILRLEQFRILNVEFRANSSFDLCISHRLH